jgi:hypothetical protein
MIKIFNVTDENEYDEIDEETGFSEEKEEEV